MTQEARSETTMNLQLGTMIPFIVMALVLIVVVFIMDRNSRESGNASGAMYALSHRVDAQAAQIQELRTENAQYLRDLEARINRRIDEQSVTMRNIDQWNALAFVHVTGHDYRLDALDKRHTKHLPKPPQS